MEISAESGPIEKSHMSDLVFQVLKRNEINALCLDYICHGRRMIYLSTIFLTGFRHRWHDYGYDLCVYINTAIVRFL